MADATCTVYVETGKRRTFAGALDWPGWCRSGRDEEAALEALLDYAPRYAAVLNPAGIELPLPEDVAAFTVAERLEGNSTTDFGAPALAPAVDSQPLDEADHDRFRAVLQAGWQAFDATRAGATGRELRKGPRGGGRDLGAMVNHVREADLAYLHRVGHKPQIDPDTDPEEALAEVRRAILDTLAAGLRGQIPTRGPRGGKRWTARYFTRRVAWHLFDHTWEIEDRVI